MSVTNLRGTQWKLPAGTNEYWYTSDVYVFPLPTNTKIAYKLSGGTENEVTYTNGGYIQWGSADEGDTASAGITISSGATIPSYIYPPTDGVSTPYFYFMFGESNWWYNSNTALYGGLDDSPIITFPDTDFTNADALTFFNNQGLQLNAHEIKLVDATQLDTDLTSVADAIRTKSGGSSSLVFPTGFVTEIGNIKSEETIYAELLAEEWGTPVYTVTKGTITGYAIQSLETADVYIKKDTAPDDDEDYDYYVAGDGADDDTIPASFTATKLYIWRSTGGEASITSPVTQTIQSPSSSAYELTLSGNITLSLEISDEDY